MIWARCSFFISRHKNALCIRGLKKCELFVVCVVAGSGNGVIVVMDTKLCKKKTYFHVFL